MTDQDTEPTPELAEIVDDFVPTAAELAVVDPSDEHELMLRMDEHDVSMLLDQVQKHALRKWVYSLQQGNQQVLGLTVHAVQDIIMRLNWTGKCRIGLMPETLAVEKVVENAGNGEEPFWVATVFARDEVTGAMLPGSAMEPQRMKLRDSTANRKRQAGAEIPADNKVFDPFSRTKAIQKATRNALKAFIPQEVEETVLARFSGEQARVARIQTVAEQKAAELPAPAQGPEAEKRHARIRELYEQIKALGDGQGRQWLTPGKFHSYLVQSQGSLELLDGMIGWLEGERERIAAAFAGGAS